MMKPAIQPAERWQGVIHRYAGHLPVTDATPVVTLNEGNTPLIHVPTFVEAIGGNFDLYLINPDGSNLEQLTFDESFDGFPMFSPDGTKLVWASNRHSEKTGETNLFIADWQ